MSKNNKNKKSNYKNEMDRKTLESFKSVQSPHLVSFLIAIFILIAILVVAIVAWATNNSSAPSAFMTSGIIGAILSFLWLILRLGLFTNWRLRFVNFRNRRIAHKIDPKAKVNLTRVEFENLAKQKSWYGMIFLFAASLIIIITAVIVLYS